MNMGRPVVPQRRNLLSRQTLARQKVSEMRAVAITEDTVAHHEPLKDNVYWQYVVNSRSLKDGANDGVKQEFVAFDVNMSGDQHGLDSCLLDTFDAAD